MRRRLRPSFLPAAVLLLFLSACGGDGGGTPVTPDPDPDPEVPNPPTGPQEAPAPTLSANRTAALAPVVLGGLPAGREDLVAEVAAVGASTASDEGAYLLPLLPLGGDDYELRIPVHPVNLADGGELEVRVRGDSLVTAPATLTLEALPEAPGAFAAALDAFQEVLDARFTALGTTREAVLAADWAADLDPSLYPAAIAQTVLDDPSHDRDLRDLLAGGSGLQALLGAGEVDVDLMDRLAAAGGLTAVFEALAEAEVGGAAAPVGGGAVAAPAGPAGVISISGAAQLDDAMSRAWAAAREIDPSTATGELLQAYGLTLGALGLVTGPAGATVTAALGSALWAYQTYLEGQSKLLPTHFVDGSMGFDLDIMVFEEDRPGPGTWSNVRVSARSEGWKLDKVIADFLLNLAGNADAYSSWLKRFDDATSSLLRDAVGWLSTTQLGKLPIAESGFVEIDPQVWSDIDVTGAPWSEGRLTTGDAVQISSATTLEPVRAGEALLTVETSVSRFGQATPAFAREVVTVNAIEVDVDASDTSVSPGDVVELQITVSNALDSGLQWTLSPGASWASGPTYLGDGIWTAAIQTPASSGQFPVEATFVSTATGGARSTPGAPERSGTVRLVTIEVLVEPVAVTLQPGESQQFQAIVLGADDTSVTWTAIGPDGAPAAMGANGLFTAPAILGTYVVVATSVEDPEAEGYANVFVGGMCYWTLTIDGPSGGQWSGSTDIGHLYTDGPIPSDAFIMTFTDDGGASDLLGSVSVAGIASSTAPGSFSDGWFSFSAVVGQQWQALNPDPGESSIPTSFTFDLLINDGEMAEGRAFGTAWAVHTGIEDPVLAGFDLRFRSLMSMGDVTCDGS